MQQKANKADNRNAQSADLDECSVLVTIRLLGDFENTNALRDKALHACLECRVFFDWIVHLFLPLLVHEVDAELILDLLRLLRLADVIFGATDDLF